MTMIDSMGHSGSWLSRSSSSRTLSNLTPIGLGVVSSSLFRGGVSASGISALRLVDGAGIGASSSAGTKSSGCSGSGMYTGTWSA
ncbi:hypothetical protein Tco_0240309, partial [Tanacetum coccineum]